MTRLLAYSGSAPAAQLFRLSRLIVPPAGRRIRPTFASPSGSARSRYDSSHRVLILSTNNCFAVDIHSASLVACSAISGGISTKT
jgi:hypothetical protein